MTVEKMLVELANDHYLSLQYDAGRGVWQVMSLGPVGSGMSTKHMLAGATLKEVVRELYNDLKPGTVHAG